MDGQTKVIDLTLSDNDDSDVEMLSLQERILRMEKGANSYKKLKTMPQVKQQEYSPELEKNDCCKKDDSDSELELPSLQNLIGVQHKCLSPVKERSKEKFIISPEASEEYSQEFLSLESNAVQLSEHLLASEEELEILAPAPCYYEMTKPKQSPESNTIQQSENLLESEEELDLLVSAPKRAKKTKSKQDVDLSKELAKQEKLRLREEKKREKDLEKALKASEKELQKSKKPDECLKNMKIIIDQNIIFENESEDIYISLDGADLKYNIEENPLSMSVIWCRTLVDVTVENSQVLKLEREELENTLVLVINNENFIRMVNASTQKLKGKSDDQVSLVDHISNIKSMFPAMDITCVVIGLDKYQRSIKENDRCSLELKKISKQVSKAAIEEATTEVQIQAFINFHYFSNMKEFGEMLARFSKAIAEAPQRREKHQQKSLAFSWYADADSSCPVKLGKDGEGSVKLWQQQIKQFNSVGSEVAEAIVSKYPTLQSLVQAYNRCSSSQQAEKLLQDIVVRRNYGPLGTQRRIGPELSYKIYLFYTSRDGDQILQR
ncbi:hypothetical protein JTE90_002150 [Oedothorax gibbosus]|uniref:Crossover junction endonuclease EME1 n=1 Tax=Oedothorax gibbosus TaxID=931172 RepID=A0AAV6V6G1_9ARAC|nr:hypothetical protein JTE90_002150 [Oedothorax gibbosus]